MNELAFLLAFVMLLFGVAVPCCTLVASVALHWLGRRRRASWRAGAWPRYALLIAPVVGPVTWFISAAVSCAVSNDGPLFVEPLVLLTVIGDVTAVFFSGVMSVGFLGVPYEVYKANTLNQLVVGDFLSGLVKAAVFGLILSAIACHNGLRVTGGAAGVGRATTNTVVQTIVAVIIADLIFTGVFFALGWT